MKKICTLLSATLLLGAAQLQAQITNGQVNYELRIDQWRQTCDNDSWSDDDNEVRVGLSLDGNTGGSASWTSGGNGASCSGNLYVRRWQDDAPSTVTNNNTLMYYCTNRNNIYNYFTIYYNSWEEDGSPDCDPGGDACQSSGTYNYTFKSASKTPSNWWGYTGTSGGSFMTGNSGDFFAKTVWRYTNGNACSNALNFGTLGSGSTYSHTNSNRTAPSGASSIMGYTNVMGNTAPDVFYRFTISNSSSVVISTDNSGTNYDTYLRLYNSTSCGTQVAANDDGGTGTTSIINADLCPGTYVIQVEGFSSNSGDFNLTVRAVNKNFTGGTIAGIANGTAVCPGGDPGAFTSSAAASEGVGTVSYQWESSTTSASSGFSNIASETGLTYDPASVSQTTWFRRRATDACGNVSYSNVIQIVTNTLSTAPTGISGTTTICAGASTTLTLTGGSAGTGATAQWYSGSCGGTLVGTGNSISVSPGSSTTYYVRYSGTCNTTSCASATVTVNTLSTAPTGISGTTTICAGASTTLTLTGGSAGTGATAQWYSGSCGGTLVGTGNSISVSPGSTTTYYVRYSGTCNTTSCASATVTVNTLSTAPTGISGTTTICAGASTTLTLTGGSAGTGATAQWYSGSCGGTLVGTGNSISVSPGSSTTYYVRYSGTCNTTSCASATVTVNTLSTAPTGISGTTTICAGASTTLTLTGGSAGTGATAQWYSGSCGGTLVGTGNSISVSPGSSTTYYVRYSGTCNTTSCASATVTVNTLSTAPTGISGTTTICAGASTTLTLTGGSAGTGATAQWYSGSCGGTLVGTGNSISVSPGSTTTYYVRYSGTCNTTGCASAMVTVNPLPAAFSPSVATSMPLCYRGNAEISIGSSQTGTSYYLRENSTTVDSRLNSPGGSLSLHTANLTSNTTAYNVVAATASGCSLTVSVPSITVTAAPSSLASNNDTRTCYVNANNAFVEFVASGRSIIAVNPGTQNLGEVTVTEYVEGLPVNVQACNTNPVTQPEFLVASLNRHWVISSTVAPVSPVDVRLYIADADVSSLAAVANINLNTTDDVSGIGSLLLSKYSGPNENASFNDNCNTGGVTTLHSQNITGAITAGITGNAIASASYISYSIPGFSELWLNGTSISSPLPVELLSFDAFCEDGKVRIDWKTASEVNNAYFTVERSPDNKEWETVETLTGAGNSNSIHTYSVTDIRPLQGISYYRLRQTDYNEDQEIFAPQSVICYPGTEGTFILYPNPAGESVTLSFHMPENSPGMIELTDMTGRVVIRNNVSLAEGQNTLKLEGLGAVQPALYTIRIFAGNRVLYSAPLIIKQ